MEFKTNVGKKTEDEVQAAIEAAFSSDFVFRSPRREGGKEVTDVLVLFDDVCLVIQAKAEALPTASRSSASSLAWAEKNLRKASRQVSGAVRALKAGRVHSVENARRGRVPFDIKTFPYIYGLVVMDHESIEYDPYEVAPSLRKIDAHVTVLSYRDFWNLCDKLDTPNDLINYFEHRPVVLVPTLSPKVHGEGEVFGYYMERLEDVMEVRAIGEGRPLTAGAAHQYAESLRMVVDGEYPDQDAGKVFDDMISRMHDSDPEMHVVEQVGIGEPTDNQAAYFEIATELARIPRVRRIALGTEFRRIVRLADEADEECHQVTHSQSRSDCVVLVASPKTREERKDRAEYLVALTALAKEYHGVRKAIGIATEAGAGAGRSYDTVLLDWTPTADPDVKELGREVFGEATRHLVAI